MKRAVMVVAAGALAACAANVERGPVSQGPMPIPAAASRNVVLNVTGSGVATRSEDWEPFKGEWRSAVSAAATARGADFAPQEGRPRATGEAGTLVVVDVRDYRYLSAGARFGFGVMTGNAYIDSTVTFRDLASGANFGERSYNTSSSAWQGVFSAMTSKQVQAVSQEIVAEINPR